MTCASLVSLWTGNTNSPEVDTATELVVPENPATLVDWFTIVIAETLVVVSSASSNLHTRALTLALVAVAWWYDVVRRGK